ncbi:hypothetical protein L249_0778 [Ophiocordyceps polyrhachis-furcata BCC 54312]|uniref:Up-regulated in Daf-2 domain-containing protein n=1 Tax=Ophiocordyceps polyrhachis-furcata BCC 54312 TaxID=1330021 RepID=A0A367LCM8_9HYPO|nr:hypothetical protein L249_0778 [Ophiocordyceps polyrhachis-furcata BCC 54312]
MLLLLLPLLSIITTTAVQVSAEIVHRRTNVTVWNQSHDPMVAVSVIHKYSSVYKDRHEWPLLSPGEKSSDFMQVDYHTGFGTIGQDWWLISWYGPGMVNYYISNPNNFRGVIDFLEAQAPAVMITSAITVASVAATPAGFGAVLGASVAAVTVAKATSDAVFNSESTVGFKKHFLEAEDEDEPVVIIVKPDNEIVIHSKSDESATVYRMDRVPPELRTEKGKKKEAWWSIPVPDIVTTTISGPPLLHHLPRAPGWPLLGLLPDICNQGLYSAVLNNLFHLARDTGISCSSVGPMPLVYLRHPSVIRQVFVANADSITRLDRHGYGPFGISQRLVGWTAATAEGETWHRWRNDLLRSFQNTAALRRSFPHILRLAERHVRSIIRHHPSGSDLGRFMEAYALDTVWFITLGVDDMSNSLDDMSAIMADYGSIVGSPSHLWRHILRSLLSGRPYREPDRVEDGIRRRIDDLVMTILNRNINSDTPHCRGSLLRRLSSDDDDDDDDGSAVITPDVLAQARQVFSLGHDASGVVLVWAIYELSQHPHVIRRLRQELGDNDCTRHHIDFDRLRSLPYLDAVVTEIFRLHPPISTTARMVTKPIVVETCTKKSVVIPKGTELFSSVYLLHRDEQVWGDSPAAFVPDRWLRRLPNEAQNRCEYLPFLTGSRACPSSGFVLLQVKTMLAALFLRADVEIVNREAVEKSFGGVIRPAKPVPYKVCEMAR